MDVLLFSTHYVVVGQGWFAQGMDNESKDMTWMFPITLMQAYVWEMGIDTI